VGVGGLEVEALRALARALGFIRLMRPPNCLMMGFAVLVGAVVASGELPAGEALRLSLGFTTAFTLLAASNALNDYYDREIDAINEPGRPIPSGLVRPEEALALSALLTILGLLSAYLTGTACLILALLAMAIADTYVTLGKKTGLPGNAMVSACVAIPFLYGSLLAVGRITGLVAAFASIAFLANLGREVNKGIVDVPGDASRGIRTVAVRWGPRAAAHLSAALYLSAVVLSWLPPLLGLVSWAYIPPIIATDAGFVWSSISIIKDQGRENAKRVKNSVLIWMTMGMIGFLMGSLI